MFASSSAKVSQGGEEGEPGSDRHHRGYVLGRGIPGQDHPPGRRIPAGACSEGPGAPVAGKHRDLQRVGVWSTTGLASGGMVSGVLYPPEPRCDVKVTEGAHVWELLPMGFTTWGH